MAQRDNIISFKGQGRVAPHTSLDGNGRRIVGTCRDVVVRTMPQLLNGLFEKLDDALYELAEKSDNNSLQTAYFDAMREVRKERSPVDERFVQGLLNGYDKLWKDGPRAESAKSDSLVPQEGDLSLVNEDELEESLAVTNLISKGDNRYHRELYALDQRFGYLLGGLAIDAQTNPLAPTAICNSFRDAIEAIEVDIPVKLVIYKLFDKQVMHYVGGMYDEINSLLAGAGIMPRLTPTIRRNPVAPAVRRPAGQNAEPSGGTTEQHAYGEDSRELQAELFGTLQQLLNERRSDGSAEAAAMASLPRVDTRELLGALSALQHSNVAILPSVFNGKQSESDLRGCLTTELQLVQAGEVRKALGKADDDTIDVISMLFEFILEDRNLPDAMKALISRLQIPMLKVAILDKTFFSKKQHPARRLLNNMAQAAIGWTDDGDRSESSLYGRIESIVKRVLMEFEDDPTLFAELSQEFDAYLERERKGAEVAEERTNQVTRGKEQLKAAKKIVAREINSRLEGRLELPEVVRSLLQEGWKDVLLLSYLRQGPESNSWKDALTMVDRLLWSVEPKAEYAARQELLRNIPEILKKLREGLGGISYDQHKMARLFKELQACHIACLRGSMSDAGVDHTGTGMGAGVLDRTGMQKHSRDEAEKEVEAAQQDGGERSHPARTEGPSREEKAASATSSDSDTETEVEEITLGSSSDEARGSHAVSDEYVEQAENLVVGTWLELTEEDGNSVRIKLSWKSDVSDAYIFVNRKGIKVAEMTLQGLAMLFRRKTAVVLEEIDIPIMDRALHSMVEALKKHKEAKSGSMSSS